MRLGLPDLTDIAPVPPAPAARASEADLVRIALAAELVAHAQTRVALAEAKRDAVFAEIKARYALGDGDRLDMSTGEIVRGQSTG